MCDFCHKCNSLGHVPDFDMVYKFYSEICVGLTFRYLCDQKLYLTEKNELNF